MGRSGLSTFSLEVEVAPPATHKSGGEPWAFSVSGQHHPQVLRSMEDAGLIV
jgi:hypothetical protein